MVNISTGHQAKSADLVRARGIGMGTALVAARETAVRKYPHKTGHICRRVFLFRKLALSLSTVLRLLYLERYHAGQTRHRILFQKV